MEEAVGITPPSNLAKDTHDDDSIILPSGDALTYDEAYQISATTPTTFIVLAGDSQCGKTTLITTLYQQFLQAIPSRYYFAGSQTLQAFEKRAYLSRSTSEALTPDMQRTVWNLEELLHLRVWDSSSHLYSNLLLTDFSGEEFKSILGNPQLAREDFRVVSAANFFIILLDGENLSLSRARELEKASNFIQTFYDAGLFKANTKIIVALSKFDLLVQSYKADQNFRDFINGIPAYISKLIPSISANLIFIKLAAMPPRSNIIPVGYGLDDLLSFLLTPGEIHPRKRTSSPPQTFSEFDLFQERVLR